MALSHHGNYNTSLSAEILEALNRLKAYRGVPGRMNMIRKHLKCVALWTYCMESAMGRPRKAMGTVLCPEKDKDASSVRGGAEKGPRLNISNASFVEDCT